MTVGKCLNLWKQARCLRSDLQGGLRAGLESGRFGSNPVGDSQFSDGYGHTGTSSGPERGAYSQVPSPLFADGEWGSCWPSCVLGLDNLPAPVCMESQLGAHSQDARLLARHSSGRHVAVAVEVVGGLGDCGSGGFNCNGFSDGGWISQGSTRETESVGAR